MLCRAVLCLPTYCADRLSKVPNVLSGCVSDPEVAVVMSWAAQQYMSTVVVTNDDAWRRNKEALQALNGDLKIWPLNRIRPFRVAGR